MQRLEKSKDRKRRMRNRGEKTSKRLTRTYDQIAKLRARVKRRALDWQHKTTTELAETFSRIGVEQRKSRPRRSRIGTKAAPASGEAPHPVSALQRAVEKGAVGTGQVAVNSSTSRVNPTPLSPSWIRRATSAAVRCGWAGSIPWERCSAATCSSTGACSASVAGPRG